MKLSRILLSSILAALFALAWNPVASGGDGDKKGEEKNGKKPRGEEERKAAEKAAEEKRRAAEKAAEDNWDDRTRKGNFPWPEPPDTGEMLEAVKSHKAGGAAGECEGEPKPGVGGYRKPAADGDGDAEAAEAAGGGFGEGGKEHAAAPPKDEKKDDKKDEKKDDKKEEHK